MQTMQNRQNKRQRGGLILGVILGVLMGLGIAFFVFSYANKTPAPQINKAQTRSSSQDEAEAEKNKNWDPNSPLYGKNPMKPMQPASGTDAAPSGSTSSSSNQGQQSTASNEPSVMKIPSATPIPKPDVTQIEHKSITPDPVGDLIKSKSKSAATAPDTLSYFVQLGAFRSQEEAENQRAKLALSGVETKITEREQSGHPVYRVRMGPYTSKEEAERMKDKMASTGMETSLVRVQR